MNTGVSAVASIKLLHQEEKDTTSALLQPPYLLSVAKLQRSFADNALVAVHFVLVCVPKHFTPLYGSSDQSHAMLLEQLGTHLVHSLIFVGMYLFINCVVWLNYVSGVNDFVKELMNP